MNEALELPGGFGKFKRKSVSHAANVPPVRVSFDGDMITGQPAVERLEVPVHWATRRKMALKCIEM